MGKKAKSTGKRKQTKKASLTKLSNKRLNKLAKQGKLKVKRKPVIEHVKRRFGGQPLKPTDPNVSASDVIDEEEADIPLVEADYEYFAKPGRDFDFLKLDDAKGKKGRKRKKPAAGAGDSDGDDDELERRYEAERDKAPPEKEMRALLPIKTKQHGVVPQMVERETDNHDDENADATEKADESAAAANEEVKQQPLKPVTTAELFAQRRAKIEDLKQQIAGLCSAVCENPEENYKALRELRTLGDTCSSDVSVTCHKLLMVSLTEVFKDIIPSYKIRERSDKERTQSMKKDTKKLFEFEESLLKQYKLFVKLLQRFARGKTAKPAEEEDNDDDAGSGDDVVTSHQHVDAAVAKTLCLVATRCLCDLLATHPHFNCRTDVIGTIVPLLTSGGAEPSNTVASFVKRIFKEDKSGEVTLEITRLIGRVVKAKHFNVQPKVIDTFLSLRIKDVYRRENDIKEKRKVKEEKRKIMSRREKKRQKQMVDLERELKEAAVMTDSKKRLRINSEIISAVFLTYFRVLKQARDSQLLPSVLEGLAKFAHLINIEFFDDLFSVISELVRSDELTYRESLHCLLTAFTLLQGQGEALNIDPLTFYQHLYKILFDLHIGCSSEEIPLALRSLDTMIGRRKKQVSLHRLFAFIKRLSILALQLQHHAALGILATLRSLLMLDSKTDMMLDTEFEGSGKYLPELDDCEHSNAASTALYELHLLRRHYHPAVKQYSRHLLRGAPSHGAGSLPVTLANKHPNDLYTEFDSSADFEFKPKVPNKAQSKKKAVFVGDYLQTSIQDDVNRVLAACGDVTTTMTSSVSQQPMECMEESMDTTEPIRDQRNVGEKTAQKRRKVTDSKHVTGDASTSVKTAKKRRRKTAAKEINIGALENL